MFTAFPIELVGLYYHLELNAVITYLAWERFKAAFTRQTKVGKLVLANSSWCVWTAQKQSAYRDVGKLLATNRT